INPADMSQRSYAHAYRDDVRWFPVTRGPLTHPHRVKSVQHMVVTVRHARCTCDDAGLPRNSRSCPTSSPIRGMVCTTAQLWQLPPVLATAPNRLPTRVTSWPLLQEFRGPVRCLDGGIELAALLCHLVYLPSQGGYIDGRHPPDLRAGRAVDPGRRSVDNSVEEAVMQRKRIGERHVVWQLCHQIGAVDARDQPREIGEHALQFRKQRL